MTGPAPRSLLLRLGLTIILMHTVILVALGAYAYVQVSRAQRELRLQELSRLADMLGAQYAPLVGGADGEADGRLASIVAGDRIMSGARITVILPDGRVIADSHRDPATMDNHADRVEIREALAGGTGSETRFSQTLQQRLMYVARSLSPPSPPGSVVRAALPVDEVDAALHRLWGTLAAAALLSLLLTSGAIYVISNRLGRTIGLLADGAARFTAGQLDHRVPTPPTNELARLAGSLNVMAEQLGDRIEQLQRQDAEQRAILQSMSNGVLALDLRQHILSFNRAAERILRLPADSSVRGMLLPAVVREPALNQFIETALYGPRSYSEEFSLGPDRARRIRARSEPLMDPRGDAEGVLVVLEDVTELRRLESLRSDFAANVSHELRTPITNIKGYVETLQEVGLDDEPRAQQFLGVIKANADRLAAIIDDILALTRVEEPGARDRLQLEPTPVRTLLHSVIAQFGGAAEAKRIELRCEVDEPAERPLRTRLQRQLMEQAMGNLLSNAISYSPAETTVTLSARRRADGAVELAVLDEGPGIAAQHLPRLFERFYRVDKGRSRQLGGTGLGLAIVKHVALLHGGQAVATSEVGKGSTFSIILPDSATVDERVTPADPMADGQINRVDRSATT